MRPTAALNPRSVTEIIVLALHHKMVCSIKYTLSQITLKLTDVTSISPLCSRRLPLSQSLFVCVSSAIM